MTSQHYQCDVLIVGGGINGAGIARDAAGRGLSVILCEQDDLASHTSSASSKLIHGGLRYLEHYEFGLVRKALREREVLLRAAPHIIQPLRFVMPHDAGQRPFWLLRAGLFLYDHLAPRGLLPGSAQLDLRQHQAGAALQSHYTRGFIYSDAWVDDARLVVLNALDAAEKGARVFTRTRCVTAVRHADRWLARLRTTEGANLNVSARCLINATGAWAAEFLRQTTGTRGVPLRLVKGSHILVPRLFDHPHAYVLQHQDRRVVFALPYQHHYTLIGTTDIDHDGDPGQVAVGQEEVHYLCALASRYFRKPVAPGDVVWSYSGVRPLLEDAAGSASAVTRDYRLALDSNGVPAMTVLGGKITTFRKLAEEAVNRLAPLLGNHHGAWTATACLPGGDIRCERPDPRSVLEFDAWRGELQQRYAWLPPALSARYARAYGTRIHTLLHGCTGMTDLGRSFGAGLYQAELRYLMRHEWARCADDVLWRRSKLGLHMQGDRAQKLDAWMAQADSDETDVSISAPGF